MVSNDNFADRVLLNGTSVNTTGTNVSFTGELGEPDHAGISSPLNSAWWSWTAAADGIVTIDTFGSNYDTSLAVYTGSAVNSLTEIASNDDNGMTLQSAVRFTVSAGTTYQIAVDGFFSNTGLIDLNINLDEGTSMVSNDNFADRISLNGTSVSTTGNSLGFTGEPGEPDHVEVSSPLNSGWWSWTAAADGIVTIDTFGSNYDTTLAVYTGSAVNSLTEIASNDDDSMTFQSAVQFTVSAGTTYQIAVDGFSSTTGLIDLNINLDIDDTLISGTSNDDTLFGTVENDQIEGLAGNDTIFGSEGINTLLGGDGNDLIYGGSQLDVIRGGSGNDTIFASEGNNEIFGDAGDDIIYSGSGNDFINSGSGNDTLWLGGGEDLIVLESGNGFDTINNFQLGLTTFDAGDSDQLSIVDGANGAEISSGGDLLAVVRFTQATTLIDNLSEVFV
ncbi:calcium-binding protein [Moorena sp. SIO3A2]|uniref:calcium-binding protein n=1 Tax=Moorena sp. SIO3A2 TaxID=2607841 RepID=UPI0013B84D47|nr:calcium-binding protein [Moorena sp. SIO3A2]NER85601.1 calcium-binding protein [Moorena sp. SIO3A2]